ncbi:MAG: patatin-like phospholipase family protein [Actinomycetota bacterium]|nr:patatin-like phospholipase family protein [Actinomycetota bacterium]
MSSTTATAQAMTMQHPARWVEEADGVFRGGGVKGIALAGALAGFAEHPEKPVKRWVNVAGASAGAIIACYLACGRPAQEMVELLTHTPFASFRDSPGGLPGGVVNLIFRRGLARGEVFERWFDEQLNGATFAHVSKAAAGAQDDDWHLKLIAVDVTKRRLLVLPEDLKDYRLPKGGGLIDPAQFPIARAARMSMSIPYFFEPVELVHRDGTQCQIIDGGTLSNFPVWLFDVDPSRVGRPPVRPTFGFTLTGGRSFRDRWTPLTKVTPWPLRFAFDIFHTAQDAWDARFVSQSTCVRTVTVSAADVATTDFDLSEDRQRLLLANGRNAAREFLDKFSLEDYVNSFHATVTTIPATLSR